MHVFRLPDSRKHKRTGPQPGGAALQSSAYRVVVAFYFAAGMIFESIGLPRR